MVEVIVRQEGKEEEGKVYVGKDHVPIQKALDYVNNKGGGKVFIEKGTYLINNISNKGVDNYGYKGVQVYSNTELCGEGVNTILKGDYSDTHNFPSTIAVLNAENVKVHDIKITKGYCGIILYRSNNIFISDCNVSKTGYNGIYLYNSSNNTITSNICSNNNSSDGIYLYSSSNNTITSNICSNSSDGIYLDSSSNNTITSNICSNNSNGIYLDSSSNNTITSNICSNNNSDGIYLISSSISNTITGNTCSNNNCHGIHLYDSSNNNTITSNICSNSGKNNGIYLNDSSNNTITSNVSNLSDNGSNNKLFANFT